MLAVQINCGVSVLVSVAWLVKYPSISVTHVPDEDWVGTMLLAEVTVIAPCWVTVVPEVCGYVLNEYLMAAGALLNAKIACMAPDVAE